MNSSITLLTKIKENMQLNNEQKRQYEKPSMKVVEMQHRSMLLAGSGNELDPLSPFAPGNDPLG